MRHMIYPENRWFTDEEIISHANDDLRNNPNDLYLDWTIVGTVNAAVEVAHYYGTATFTDEVK